MIFGKMGLGGGEGSGEEYTCAAVDAVDHFNLFWFTSRVGFGAQCSVS